MRKIRDSPAAIKHTTELFEKTDARAELRIVAALFGDVSNR
jgi:hypothetical protein